MGIPNITTNLSGFGCFMEDLLETPEVSYRLRWCRPELTNDRTTGATSLIDEGKVWKSLSTSSSVQRLSLPPLDPELASKCSADSP